MGEIATSRTAILLATSANAHGEGALVLDKVIAGESVIDRQLGQLAGSGHKKVILYADPADPIARQLWTTHRSGQIDLSFAISGSDLVTALEDVEQVTLVAHATLWQSELMTATLDHGPLIATHASAEPREGFERIDAGYCWSGLAVLPAQMVRDTARTLGEWDLQSTLLRTAIQAGMPRMPAPAELVGSALERADIDRFVALSFAAIEAHDDQILTPAFRAALSELPRLVAQHLNSPRLWLAGGTGALILLALALAWFLPGPWVFAPFVIAAPMVSTRLVLVRLAGKWSRIGAIALYGALTIVSCLFAARVILPDTRPAAVFVLSMAIATTASAAIFSGKKVGLPPWWRVETMALALIVLTSLVGFLYGFSLFSAISFLSVFTGAEARSRLSELRKF